MLCNCCAEAGWRWDDSSGRSNSDMALSWSKDTCISHVYNIHIHTQSYALVAMFNFTTVNQRGDPCMQVFWRVEVHTETLQLY